MATLKAWFKLKEEIPTTLVDYYKQDGDKFVLDAEGVVPATDLQTTEGRLSEMRNTNVNLKKQFARFPGVNADDAKTIDDAVERFTDLSNREEQIRDHKLVKAEGVDALVAQRMAKANDEWAKKEDGYKKNVEQLNEKLANEIIDRQLIDAASKLGVRASAIEDIKLRGRRVFKMENGAVVAKDERGEVVYGKDAKALTIDEFISDLATTDKGRHLFGESKGTGSGDRGAGSGGGAFGGVNPWKHESWSPSRQGDIFKQDKELAKRLAAEAGKPLPESVG